MAFCAWHSVKPKASRMEVKIRFFIRSFVLVSAKIGKSPVIIANNSVKLFVICEFIVTLRRFCNVYFANK